MSAKVSQWICPRPVRIFGFIPTPWICATVCTVVGDNLRCPKCELVRPIVWERKRGKA